MEQAKFIIVYAILPAILLALNASPANKCQHKFQPSDAPEWTFDYSIAASLDIFPYATEQQHVYFR